MRQGFEVRRSRAHGILPVTIPQYCAYFTVKKAGLIIVAERNRRAGPRKGKGMNKAGFAVDREKCLGCGLCVRVCPGAVLRLEGGAPVIADFENFGWNGCWRCEHCLAVCPAGAISVLGKTPEGSLPPAPEGAAETLDALIANRRSCRRYQRRNVDGKIIDGMLSQLANAPNGGNKQLVEFTPLDDMESTERFRRAAYRRMEELAARGVYPRGFDKASYADMKRWEATVRPDMLLCGAPHLLIPHAPRGSGEPVRDTMIAAAYFELLCASRGLGAVMMTFPLDSLENMPEVKALLEIPEDHYTGAIIGFGYPEIRYARGSQRKTDESRIHRLRI